MTKISTATRLSLALVFTVGACVAVTPRAGADPAPTATDVVGVGSDIVQNSMGFLADGDIHGNDGYNTTGNKNRLVSFDATADGNGRNAFSDPALGTPAALNPTVILRAGTSPVQRPNGGTAGLNALVNDSAGEISYVRSPNLPTAAQQAAATSNLGSALHTIQFAQDKQVIATAATTNAPSALSVNELLNIYNGTYKHWNEIPGNTGGSTDAIIPEIPQPGAGVRTIFLNALKAANGGATVTPAGNVVPVQQNDPTTITGLSAADQKNAIVPFPVGRFKLLNDGYFRDPTVAYNSASPPPALTANGIDLQTSGAAPDGGTAFAATLPYYVVFRESDYASTTPWQPGSDLNWVQELFFNPGGPDPYVKTAPAVAILTAAGITAHYADLGNTSSG